LTLLFLLLVVDLVFTFFTFGQEVEVKEKLRIEAKEGMKFCSK
jgi:hypothetical protein